jgi:hypothetical protein
MNDLVAKDSINSVRTLGFDLLELTGGVPASEIAMESPFNPPYNMMENYGCEQIRTYGGGGYGFGTMHKIDGGFATAIHVTQLDSLQLARTVQKLEARFGKCVRFENTDIHIFGRETRPTVEIPELMEGVKFTVVGCPAGSTFPEIHHCEYYLDNPDVRGHWLKSITMTGQTDPKAIVGGNSGGGVYAGHLTHAELKDATSLGVLRAQGDIRIGAEDEYDHFCIISFWTD